MLLALRTLDGARIMEDGREQLAKITAMVDVQMMDVQVVSQMSTAVLSGELIANPKSGDSTQSSTSKQILLQMRAQASGILAEGAVLSSFKHKGLSGTEREEPIRRFLRNHLPGRFHVGQGAIASAETILEGQRDIVVADRDSCFMLLNTGSAQLFPIETVHLIVEVRSVLGDIKGAAKSLRAVRGLRAVEGIQQFGARGSSEPSNTKPPVQTLVIYHGPKDDKTVIDQLKKVNAQNAKSADRLTIDFILVLAKKGDQSPAGGYLVGYTRTEKAKQFVYPHHYYPTVRDEGLDGPTVIYSGEDSFAFWYAAILNHLNGVTTYPPNLYSYLGQRIIYLPRTDRVLLEGLAPRGADAPSVRAAGP
jgi:hypothetical protein